MTRDEFVALVLRYSDAHALPVEAGTAVGSVERDERGGFLVRTAQGDIRARTVVATTGNLNVAKRPAFAVRLPGVEEMLQDCGGILVAPGDATAYGAAIGELLDDPERAAAIGAEASAIVRERYTWEAVARRTEALLWR